MVKVAVSGANGFIGRWVVKKLTEQGNSPILLYRKNTEILPEHESLQCHFVDYSNPGKNLWESIGSPQNLVHLGWSFLDNYNDLRHFEIELPMHYAFLKQLVESGLQHVLITGTCMEYGLIEGELNEEMLTQPITPYGYAKNALCQQLLYLQKNREFEISWARLFYLYGREQRTKSLYGQLKDTISRGEVVFRMSGGEQLRDYMTVEAIAGDLSRIGIQSKGAGVVNLSSGVPVSVRKLVEKWIQENNWAVDMELGYYSYPKHEAMAFWGNRDKLDQYFKSCKS